MLTDEFCDSGDTAAVRVSAPKLALGGCESGPDGGYMRALVQSQMEGRFPNAEIPSSLDVGTADSTEASGTGVGFGFT